MGKYSLKKNNKNKKRKNIPYAIMHVHATFNNTIISITDNSGNLISWSSCGANSFKGSRKSTPYAVSVATENAVSKAKNCGLQSLIVEIKGPGVGREAALRALQNIDVNVSKIIDKTYFPHNGCRPPKKRRV